MAVNVPPVLLLYPLGSADVVEVAPDRLMAPWGAVRWFSGEGRPPVELLGGVDTDDQNDEAMREWEDAYLVGALYRRHDALVARYRFIRSDTMAEFKRAGNPDATGAQRPSSATIAEMTDRLMRDIARASESLRRHRSLMQNKGCSLPPLPPDVILGDELGDE
jgi:hypothetical protein